MEIIRPRQTIRYECYALEFEWNDQPGAGFLFDCDKEGRLLLDQIAPTALQNLADCQSGAIAVTYKGVKDVSNEYRQPAVGRCSLCGREVELTDSLTNECECGALYNGCGQDLAPRSQWEETWDIDGQYAWGQGIGEDF